ncbi:hypothetical protein QYS62_010507 [Fusarium acuminatum]|uniref:BZIP domain-containing protein n=1 Tax=Fusarium acuminatum TaxID=5515 RepID=A0ABZ2X882_9HYPO
MTTFQAQASCIQLTAMPQLVEALSARDDWTGTKDAAARRRAQTRLNMRAYRKRKAQEKKAEALSDAVIKSEPLIECWDIKQESMSTIPASHATQLYSKRTPVLPSRPRRTQFNFVFPLSPDHLITLLQYNALRALAVNRTLISGILTTPLDCDVEAFHVVPYPTNPDSVPLALLPTILQQTIPHGDWIDMFPCAEGRDNLIRAAGTFDEDELWDDCIGGLYEGYPDDEMERRASSSPITRLAVPARTSSKQENRLPKNEDEKVPNPSERISRKGKVPWENRYENESKGSLEASLTESAKQILYASKKLKRQVSMDETY